MVLNIASNLLGKNCVDILFKSIENQGQLYDTTNAQPIILAVEVALAQYLMECGAKPKALLGHSLGEYSAFVISGILSFEDAVNLIVKRSKLMAKTDEGLMVSVMSSLEQINDIKHKEIDIAAINGYKLITLSGRKSDIENFISLCNDLGISYHLLHTNKAFHSHLLDNILEEYRREIQSRTFGKPLIPIVSNVFGKLLSEENVADPNYLVNQTRLPVQFVKSIEFLTTNYNPIFIEVGPGTTLKTLTKSVLLDTKCDYIVLNTLPHPKENTNSLNVVQKSLATLWENNYAIEWRRVKNWPQKFIKVQLPTYPFELNKCYVSNVKNKSMKNGIHYYERTWKRSDLCAVEKVDTNNYEIIFLKYDDDVQDVIFSLQQVDRKAILIYKCKKDVDNSAFLLKVSQQCLSLDERNKVSKICFVSYNGIDLQNDIDPSMAKLQSQVKVINQELSFCKCFLVDIVDSDNWRNEVLEELSLEESNPIVALRHGERFVEHFEYVNFPEDSSQIVGDSTIILGGTGNIGLQYAETLLKTTKQKIFLIQRSSVEALKNPKTKYEITKSEKIEFLETMWRGRIFILSADVGNYEQLSNAVKTAEKINGGNPIHSVIHVAGVDASMHYKLLKDVDDDFCKRCFYAKKQGLQNLAKIAEVFGIKCCHVVSSISSILGGIGMFVYGGMHSYVDAFVLKQRRSSSTNWTAINWDAWNFRIDENEPAEFRQGSFGEHLNQLAISSEDGSKVIEKIYGKLSTNIIVSNANLHDRYDNWVLGKVKYEHNDDQVEIEKASRPEMREEYISPSTSIQKDLSKIWSELLGIKNVGIRDNFFELGGHSLLALQMLQMIDDAFGEKFSIVDLFEFPTIEKIAENIDKKEAIGNYSRIHAEALKRFSCKKDRKKNASKMKTLTR